MKNSIKRAQSQARLSFAERENQRSLAGGESNFRPKVRQLKKTLLTLVALLAVTTGAWAIDPNAVTAAEITSDVYSGWSSYDDELFKASELPGFQAVTEDQAKSWTGAPSTGKVRLFYEFVADGHVKYVIFKDGVYVDSYEENELERYYIYEDIAYGGSKYFYTTGPAPAASSGPKVAWDKATKTGTFTMPGGNVTLEIGRAHV